MRSCEGNYAIVEVSLPNDMVSGRFINAFQRLALGLQPGQGWIEFSKKY